MLWISPEAAPLRIIILRIAALPLYGQDEFFLHIMYKKITLENGNNIVSPLLPSIRPPPAPVPCPNLYAQLNALQLVLDPRSLVWINLFALDLRQSLEQFMEIYKLSDSQKPDEHVDIKVDGLMLKVSCNNMCTSIKMTKI